jgi:photosystem II stability/assembly factor-like uncharacterized protein
MKLQTRIVIGAGLILTLSGLGQAQQAEPKGPALSGVEEAFDSLHFRSIGPASMSGRIADLAVYELDPAIYYVGTAHGGVWKTTNNGTTFEAQFQNQGLISVGAVAISQSNPDLVWVGTGESNNRQSTSWGDGVYKSTDGGKTYNVMGLRTSRHINRIVIDPKDNNVVFVAATGSLWGPGGDRGVYKTTDGGRSWKQVLKVDDDTGANDLVMDASNNQILYASMYQRRRTACCMNGGGPGSGIWKSTDGGENWTRLKGGVLDGPLGRIALDVYRKRPNILYALIEGPSQAQGAGEAGPGPGGAAQAARAPLNNLPTGLYRSDDGGGTWRKVNNANPRPMYFSQVRIDPNDADVVYLGGVDLHQTLDGGKTMNTAAASRTHSDHHAIWINPANSKHVLIGNDGGVAVSYDMSKTWNFIHNLPVGLFYHVGYDMATPYNVCGGMQDNYTWCGPSAVRGSAGISSHHWATVQGGDGFVALQDPSDYRIAFSESQDGNMVRIDRRTFETMSIRPLPAEGEPAYRWHWDTPLTFSPHDPKVLYAAAQKVFRSPDRGHSWIPISGDLTSGANRDDIATMGVKGSEIRFSRNDGIAAWPSIVSFAESPRKPGLLYAGTDDGQLAVSRDGGKKWDQVIANVPGVPAGLYVSEVVPSRFDEGTVYATFDGHRQNDFEAYVYASTDAGRTWRSIVSNLKGEVARTLTEDIKNPDVLYLGTETGLFVTLDRGKSWVRIKANLPTVRIDEITIHPRDNAMILATHGRAIWILDHLEPIQEFGATRTMTGDAKIFTLPSSATFRRPARDRNYEFWGDHTFFGENPPQAARISWYAKQQLGEVSLKITDAAGREMRDISGQIMANSNKAGIQTACWDLRVQPIPAPQGAQAQSAQSGQSPQSGSQRSPFGAACAQPTGFGGGGGGGGGAAAAALAGPYVPPGMYTVALVVGGKTVDTKPLRVTGDPEVVLTDAERRKLFDMAMELHELHRRAADSASAMTPLNTRMTELAKEIGAKTDLPADVKTSFESLSKEIAAMSAKLTPPQGGGFGGGGAAAAAFRNHPVGRLGLTKTGLSGGMWPTEQILRSYTDSKAQIPKLIAESNALLSRASTLSTTLTTHNLNLNVPAVKEVRH